MAGKSSIQKLIEQYEAQIAGHQRAVESKIEFINALRATQKAKARVKPSRKAEASERAVNE